MTTLANTRDSATSTTTGALIARGASPAVPSAGLPTGWAMPVGVTPLALGFLLALGLLVYWDRREIVFRR